MTERVPIVSSEEFEEIWVDAPAALVLVDTTSRVIAINDAALAMLGCDRPAALDRPLTSWLSEKSGRELLGLARAYLGAGGSERMIGSMARGGRVFIVMALARLKGRDDILSISMSPAADGDRPIGERELREARMAASIIAASKDGIFSVASDGSIATWNSGAEALYGYSSEEIVGRHVSLLVPEALREESSERVRQVMSGHTVTFETERLAKDGRLVPVAISGSPLLDASGRPAGIAAIHRDISTQMRHESQMRFVMRELAHRTKNLLAIIQSIERQTARGVATTEEFHDRFSSRLQALAAAHDLLVEGNWGGALISDMVRRQLEIFSDQIGDRIRIEGPPMRLPPAVAQTLSLALHELATNATKYGALSVPSGRVSVEWGIRAGENDKRLFRIEWRESGGPPASPPSRRGFGMLAIERLAPQALNGEASLDFASTGLQWILSAEPSSVEEEK